MPADSPSRHPMPRPSDGTTAAAVAVSVDRVTREATAMADADTGEEVGMIRAAVAAWHEPVGTV